MFTQIFHQRPAFLMEGALGERLKREYRLPTPPHIELAGHIAGQAGKEALASLWLEYAGIAAQYHLPFLATTPTRRVNQERIRQAAQHAAISYPAFEPSLLNEALIYENVRHLRSVQSQAPGEMYVGGMIGCRGDAYTGAGCLSQADAADFHQWEIEHFARAGVDFLYAALIPTLPEALGIAEAVGRISRKLGIALPYIISFTLTKGGTLPDGTIVSDAIETLDRLAALRPLCYMTNCVHPSIVYEALMLPANRSDAVRGRFMGIQANTSALSFEALDGSVDLQGAEPAALAADMLRLREVAPIKIWGGCCGTDGRHIEAIARGLTADPIV